MGAEAQETQKDANKTPQKPEKIFRIITYRSYFAVNI
jgi:hypothetical protein